ncbi:MAG TPA: hypothetical protein PLR06_03580 [Cyclobacteriaceae bacterium]|nr:hypothetical protein [Cyclobacteriaceae bacterium]
MELLETQDPEKKKLIESSDRHKKALEKELGEMKEKTDRMLTNALIIGGTLAVTYFVISSISKRKKKKKKNKIAQAQINGTEAENEEVEEEDKGPSVLGQIGTRVLSEATAVLLSLAKEKLAEYLASRKNTDENS